MRIILAWLVVLGIASPAAAQDAPKPGTPTISVRGEASAEVVPDTVVVVFGVVTQRPNAADATQQNSKALADAIAAIKSEGVKPEDIATTGVSLSPQTSPPDKGPPTIVGYRAENRLTVRLKPADQAGAILAKLVDKGVNLVESVSAVVSDDRAIRDSLKADAAMNARHQAEIYATALDVKLGPVMRIEPDAGNDEPRLPLPMRVARAAPAAVPVEVGQQTISESVSVTFSLEPH